MKDKTTLMDTFVSRDCWEHTNILTVQRKKNAMSDT